MNGMLDGSYSMSDVFLQTCTSVPNSNWNKKAHVQVLQPPKKATSLHHIYVFLSFENKEK